MYGKMNSDEVLKEVDEVGEKRGSARWLERYQVVLRGRMSSLSSEDHARYVRQRDLWNDRGPASMAEIS